MTVSWKEWEGRTVDGKFVLGDYLGGYKGSAVFRMRSADRSVGESRLRIEEVPDAAAIRLMVASGAEAESQLQRWKAASELRHPSLVRILATGRATVEGREVVYAVEEFAEENLAQIVPERALTADEARAMLGPVLAALEFVHEKGLAHGRIRPSNILAAGDEVKLSSDSLQERGRAPQSIDAKYEAPEVEASGVSPAGDVWSLGITLVEVLTQHAPVWDPARMSAPEVQQDVPEPFRGIARRCLEIDPAKRCGLQEIRERLEGRTQAASAVSTPIATSATAQPKSAKWGYWVAGAAVVALAVFLIMRPRSTGGAGEQISSVQTQATQAPPPAPAKPQEQAGAKLAVEKKTAAADEIVERAMPQVSPSAQRTISGKIKVRVRVKVDANGNVSEATLKEAGSSKYFARVALEAARRWKFTPSQDASRAWTLLFAFTRRGTDASAARAR